tara:strand:+ start:7326 stop:10901 length:3576 start_codon:yes stop_codon:yes gene_type:complete
MPLTREERKLLHHKSKQPTFGNGKPDNKEGYEGDISFRKIEGSGTVEYVKTSGEWVAVASSGEMPTVRIIGSSRGGGSTTTTTESISGNYVSTITGGTGIDSTGATTGSKVDHTLSLDLNELTDTAIAVGDSIVFIDADDSNNSKKEALSDVVTLLAGDGIKNGSNKFAVDVSDFAGDGIEEDGSTENLQITPAQTTITSIYNTGLVIGRAANDTTINFGVDDVIVFDAGSSEKLRVDAAGVDVTGALTVTTDTTFGTYSDPNYSDGILQSANFASGFTGSGWKINHSSNDFTIELDNMFLRGTLSVYELLIQQIRATNGAVFVTSAAKVESVTGLASDDDDGFITFEDPSGNNICPFAVNDIIMSQRVVPGALVAGDAAGGATNVIKKLVYKVTHIGQYSTNNVATVTNIGYDNTTAPVAGDDFVRIGNTSDSNRQGLLYLTSDDSNAPFMDVKDGVDTYANWHSASTTKVRVGKLSGITDSGLNAGSALSGYGLYGGNVFLKGAINATSGHIGADTSGDYGWSISQSKLHNTGESGYLKLDGINDYLTLGTTTSSSEIAIQGASEAGGEGISIAFWIYFPNVGATEPIFRSHDHASTYYGYAIDKNSSNQISFSWYDGTGSSSSDRVTMTGDTTLSANTWYFVVITSTMATSTSGTKIYINTDSSSDSITKTGSASVTTPNYSGSSMSGIIGQKLPSTDMWGEFSMKNIAIWDVILDTNDVAGLRNSGNYRSFGTNAGTYDKAGDLQLHIDFTTGSENDLTGNISDSNTVLTNQASIENSNSFIGLVQSNASAITDQRGIAISSFYAGATANTGANSNISFGTDGKIRGNGIYVKNGLEYLITASRLFGNGSDGAASLSGSVTLTGDKYYTSLTLAASTQIHSAGYRIFVRDTLTLSGSGIKIYNNGYRGNDGANAVNLNGASASSNNASSFTDGTGAGAKSGSLLGGVVGGAGGAGGTGGIEDDTQAPTAGAGGASVSGTANCVKNYTTNNGVKGGKGGAATSGVSYTNANASGSASTDGAVSITNADLTYIIAMKDFFTTATSIPSLVPSAGAIGGGGGGGGGYGGNETTGGGGGSGGCAGGSGGHVMLVARKIEGTLSHLELEAKGGTGGAGGNGYDYGTTAGAGGAGAGGNGGDGGCVVLITGTDPSDIVIDVSGGAGGSNGSGNTTSIGSPATGVTGTEIICHV